MMPYGGRWHGDDVYFGMHYDLHAHADDTELGARTDPTDLVESLALMGPQWVQTDCKGHAGYTSWFSQAPEASVSPGVVNDALADWREATRRMGVPLHCHYSGIWDDAAAAKHPEWAVQPAPGAEQEGPRHKMCPRSPYLEELMIPQMIELIDRYGVDGFWVDGDLWGVEPCYCDRCVGAFRDQTGIDEPPASPDDPNWVVWIGFTRESYYDYVVRYCDAVHEHSPDALVCSNWLQTFRDPGEPRVPTDWISGDWWHGLDALRCDARFIATRGKPWDLMLWGFWRASSHQDKTMPWTFSSVTRLKQQAAMILSQGGNVQVYEHPPQLRDGRLVPWRMRRLGEVGTFCLERQALCQGTESVPQIVVLHSEEHAHSQPVTNLFWGYDVDGVEGAAFALLENLYSVDIMDEWALSDALDRYPVVVAPEQDQLSDAMVTRLRDYVRSGGRLMVTGAGAWERFGEEFLGAESVRVEEEGTWFVPAAEGTAELYSPTWRMLCPTTGRTVTLLGELPLRDEGLTAYPAAVVNDVGQGRVVYVPYDLFHFFRVSGYGMVRAWIGDCVKALDADMGIAVQGPTNVDVVLRRKGDRLHINLINTTPAVEGHGPSAGTEELPLVGPVSVTLPARAVPRQVVAALEGGELTWVHDADKRQLEVTLSGVRLHEVVVVRI
jgi:hypothetical protein